MGATNDRGRELRASFPLEREVLRYCHEQGITKFDLGGIDPWENPGCHRFKRGTGGKEVEYLGEWDWGTSFWLRLFGNLAIRKRQGMKQVTTTEENKKRSGPLIKMYEGATQLIKTVSGIF
jgi:lipid II:glycine glycyltransferase (peptidoglycan interpeptide bridge formation enzyme)